MMSFAPDGLDTYWCLYLKHDAEINVHWLLHGSRELLQILELSHSSSFIFKLLFESSKSLSQIENLVRLQLLKCS